VGRFACYLAPGAYDLRFTGAAIAPRGVQNVQVPAGISPTGQAATLPGMARSYVVADATARAALAKMVAGDLAYQQDTDCLYHYTGSVWELVRGAPPIDYRVPLLAGVVRSTNETSWTELAPYYWNSQNPPNVNALPWGDGEGVAFDKACVPAGAAIRFGGVGAICPGGATSYELRLYDAAAAAEVAGSTLTFASNQSHYLESADITSALASGERKLRLQCRATGGYGAALAAFLRIIRA
jgi:hypothetical protein